MAQLSLGKIVLVLCAVGVVIGGISVGKAIQHEGVHGHSPVGGRRVEGMVLPYPPIVEGIRGGFISIKIIQHLLWIVAKGEGCRAQEEQPQASIHGPASSHGEATQRECCWKQRFKYQSSVLVVTSA